MTEMKAYWHIHHDTLVEFSDDIEERIRCINEYKPAEEVPLRLHLLKPVRGKLPDAVVRAGKACRKAYVAYAKAYVAPAKAWAAYAKACATYAKACATYNKAEAAYVETLDAHKDEIEALHAQECPNCPWNGKTIFPEMRQTKEGE